MRTRSQSLSAFALLLLFACQAAPTASTAPSTAPADDKTVAANSAVDRAAADSGEKDPKDDKDARRHKEKELRQKQRELEQAGVENQVADIERTMRSLSVEDGLTKAAADLQQAQLELSMFQKEVRPRQLEEKRIGVDGSTYRAEHQKDELGELTAMYEADEFARTTKELVLKRSRRELELAERNLAVARKEIAHFEQQELPQRERELERKVVEASMAQKKAAAEAQKATLEHSAAIKKAQQRVSDLQEEITELQAELAKAKAKS